MKYKVKQICQWCGCRIKNTSERYAKFGNACCACSARFSRINKGVCIRVRGSDGKMKDQKTRDWTLEEKKDMLAERLKKVKTKGL